MLRDARMVRTYRPCSGARPTGSRRGTMAATGATRHLDADITRSGSALALDGASDGVHGRALGAAATSCTQHGTAFSTGVASLSVPSEWTPPAAAKSTAAGATSAARATGDLRRLLANEWRATKAP